MILSVFSATIIASSARSEGPTNPNFVDGNQFWGNFCGYSSTGQPPQLCMAYVEGVVDGDSLDTSLNNRVPRFCLSGQTIGQLTDVARQFAEKHPELREYAASALILISLKAAFPYPCAK
jgi:hypothetical protein